VNAGFGIVVIIRVRDERSVRYVWINDIWLWFNRTLVDGRLIESGLISYISSNADICAQVSESGMHSRAAAPSPLLALVGKETSVLVSSHLPIREARLPFYLVLGVGMIKILSAVL
jgi:hypothetical protein